MIKKIFLILSFALGAPHFVDAAATSQYENSQRNTCTQCATMHDAVNNDHNDCIIKLKVRDASLLTKTNDAELTPLLWAIVNNKQEIVKTLLRYCAAWPRCPRGRTPLHIAITQYNYQCLEILMQWIQTQSEPIQATILNAQDNDGKTALHVAAEKGDPMLISSLLKNPFISVSLKDSSGKTALHYASDCGAPEVTKILIEHGANAQETDNSGKTVLDQMRDIAENSTRSGAADVVAMLETTAPKPELVEYHAQTPALSELEQLLQALQDSQTSRDDTETNPSKPDTKTEPNNIPATKNESNASVYAAGVGFLGLVILAIETSEMYTKAATQLADQKAAALLTAAKEKTDDARQTQKEGTINIIEEDIPTREVLNQMWQTFKAKRWSKKKAFMTGTGLTLGGFITSLGLLIRG